MTVKITNAATAESGILIAEYEEPETYSVIGAFANISEAMDLAGDHFSRLSPASGDIPTWAYALHCRNQSGEYVRAGEIR